jgi:hypothetical protein
MRLLQRLFFIPSFCLLASVLSFAQTTTSFSTTNAKATRNWKDATGKTTTFDPAVGIPAGGAVASGFGFLNTTSAPSTPASRQGQIVARVMF